MRIALAKVGLNLLGEMLGLPPGVQINDVRVTDDDLQEGTITLRLEGAGLPDWCDRPSGENVPRVNVVVHSIRSLRVERFEQKKE